MEVVVQVWGLFVVPRTCAIPSKHDVIEMGGEQGISSISAAPWGSALILLISYAYIKMLGSEGLTDGTKYAILNANYIKERLAGLFDVLYRAKMATLLHEMIWIVVHQTRCGIGNRHCEAIDGRFHAPTVSFL